MATADCRAKARPMEGTRLERKGREKWVAWRRVLRTAIFVGSYDNDGRQSCWSEVDRREEGIAGGLYVEPLVVRADALHVVC